MIKSITIEINGAEIEMPLDEAKRIYAELGKLFNKPSISWPDMNSPKDRIDCEHPIPAVPLPYITPPPYPSRREIWCGTDEEFDGGNAGTGQPASRSETSLPSPAWDNRSMPEWEQQRIWERTPVTPFYAPK